jgi:transposase
LKHTPQPRTPSLYDACIGEAYVPEHHILRRIRAAVDFSFVHELTADLYHESSGRPAYNQEVILRLIFLQLHYGLSDRGVIDRAQTDHAFRLFLGLDWNHELPHPTSLTKFRNRLGEERFKAIFTRILRQAQELGLVAGRRLLLDSSAVRADVAAPGFRRLLERVLANSLDALEGTEVDLDYLRGEYQALVDDRCDLMVKKIRDRVLAEWLTLAELVAEALEGLVERTEGQEECLELLDAALERAANRGRRNVRKDDLLSDVDPDARWNSKKRGKKTEPGYLEQLTMDSEHGIVTNTEVLPGNSDDSEALQEMVEGHTEQVGLKPDEVVTDNKYQSGENRTYLQERGITDQMAAPAPKGSRQGKFSVSDFLIEFNEADAPVAMVCPAGELAEAPKWKQDKHAWVFYFKKKQCEGCSLRARCTKQKRGRQVSVDEHYQLTEAARERQGTPEGKAAQRERYRIERQFAMQKQRGGGRTRYRGLPKNRLLGWAWGIYLNVMTITRYVSEGLVELARPPGPKLHTVGAG